LIPAVQHTTLREPFAIISPARAAAAASA